MPRILFTSLAGILTLTGMVRADTIFTSQAAFLAAIEPGYYLETFDSLPQYTAGDGIEDFSMPPFSYRATNQSGFFHVGPPGDTWMSTIFADEDIVFTFNGAPVTAVGGFFFLTDFDGFVTGGTVTVTLNNGTTFSVSNATETSFIGFTTDIPILTLTLTPDQSGQFFTWPTANDFIVGVASPQQAIPEPASVVLAGLGIAGFAGLARRRWCRA